MGIKRGGRVSDAAAPAQGLSSSDPGEWQRRARCVHWIVTVGWLCQVPGYRMAQSQGWVDQKYSGHKQGVQSSKIRSMFLLIVVWLFQLFLMYIGIIFGLLPSFRNCLLWCLWCHFLVFLSLLCSLLCPFCWLLSRPELHSVPTLCTCPVSFSVDWCQP